MNLRTKLATIAAIVTFANLCVAGFNESVLDGYPTAQAWYKFISAGLAAVSWAFSHFFNQDFTPEGYLGTAYTRYLKEQKKKDGEAEEIEEIEDTEENE